MTKNVLSASGLMFTFSLLIVFRAGAQNISRQAPDMPVDEEAKLITYKAVIDVPDASIAELQTRAFNWANAYYKNPADVIRVRDTVQGKMICKARLKIYNEPDKKGLVAEAGVIEYTLNLDFKNFKYRYVITDLNWKQKSYYPVERWMNTELPGYQPVFVYYLQQTDELMKKLMMDLDKGMKQPGSKPKKDDW